MLHQILYTAKYLYLGPFHKAKMSQTIRAAFMKPHLRRQIEGELEVDHSRVEVLRDKELRLRLRLILLKVLIKVPIKVLIKVLLA